ncbi:hypothetical protein P3X46_014130 [Hevea brasiliensis]|uniref:Protein kinase domain-containing protein n=1 Tax=Hevea brasiliensis TaxID=3981 RepID=A0ABQ9M7F8_HEVBR|nr:uncharacterized protein LOC110659826 isoform X1 [Hevea brasiliensis]KAJ9175588.1 hypothetical protein P3X46_014130 [Hevea brasiliensis]
MAAVAAFASSPATVTCYLRESRKSKTATSKGIRQEVRVIGNFSHFGDAVRKDFEFLKEGIGRGIGWANETFRIPQVFKTLDDVFWLKNLEDPQAPPLEPQSWPQPSYPGLSGVDLFMADLKALEAYASYFYYVSKIWSKPLPEVYNPQDVTDYFSCRPHVVALRLLEVFSAFASATIKIRTSGIKKFLRTSSDKDINGNISQYDFGLVLKEAMLSLGPTFIKVGQSLSTRPDIIGTEISKALSELHDQIPPFPRTMAMKIIEEELGSPVESFFSYISEEPVAAASFGQVYYGNTLDGCNVAVKVQRPNLRHVVVRDIYILRVGLGLLQKIAKRKSDLRLYADELGKGLVGELDYCLEAANASKFLDAHSSFKFMHIPKVYHHLSRKRVLTMEWVVGENPTDLLSLSTCDTIDHDSAYSERHKIEAKRRLLELVSKGVESALVQLLETGLLHADPHPGNLRYTSSGKIGFLDFGLLCQMEKKHQFAMLASIVHIVNGDWASLVRSLTEMDVIRPGTNIWRVTMELEDSLGEVEFRDGIPDVKFTKVLSKIWSIALKYHFRMPPYYTLVLRSLASLEGLAMAADPNFKTFEAAYPYVVRKLLTENSAETRKILHSVVLNRRKEFRWDRLALLLKVGSTSKVLNREAASKHENSLDYLTNRSFSGVFDVAHLVLMLLPARDGVVLRKLLMTADGASLVRALVSKEAVFFRQQLCRTIADLLYQWTVQTLGLGITATQYCSQLRSTSEFDNRELGLPSPLSMPLHEYQSIFKDRRLKVIFSRIIDSARKDTVLMLKFCWTSFIMVVAASALAFHRVLVSLSEVYISRLSLASKRVAIGA